MPAARARPAAGATSPSPNFAEPSANRVLSGGRARSPRAARRATLERPSTRVARVDRVEIEADLSRSTFSANRCRQMIGCDDAPHGARGRMHVSWIRVGPVCRRLGSGRVQRKPPLALCTHAPLAVLQGRSHRTGRRRASADLPLTYAKVSRSSLVSKKRNHHPPTYPTRTDHSFAVRRVADRDGVPPARLCDEI